MTKRRLYLKETIPAAVPKAAQQADKALRRLQVQVDERRQPRTSATVNELVSRHLELAELDETTRQRYEGCFRNYIKPLIGSAKVGTIDADVLDSFYAELRRCRLHCDRKPSVDHRTTRAHECDARCRKHECAPLAASSVRQVHFLLSEAFKRAVRWKWVVANPIATGEPPAAPRPNPDPPTAAEAAWIVAESFREPAWGALVWLAMITGARRGELCALTWSKVDLENGTIMINSSVGQLSGKTWVKDTKAHQHRRVTVDAETVTVLQELRVSSEARAAAVGAQLSGDAYVFSIVPDSTEYRLPDSVGQRYTDTATRLGIETESVSDSWNVRMFGTGVLRLAWRDLGAIRSVTE